jgi:hypothetical protein
MSRNFAAGDFLVFQLEAGFALLRLLHIENKGDENIWHVSAYNEFFPDIVTAEEAIDRHWNLTISNPHIALNERAFASTQVARLQNIPLADADLDGYRQWIDDPERMISDRSIRLILGLR